MKWALMFRKLIMWQTNKESDGDDYPAYVIHYTDYSPNRKTPLEREIRVSSSPDQIKDLWEELATEGFTKGWVAVGESPAKEIATTPKPSAAVAAADGPEAGPATPAKKRTTKKAAAVPAEEEVMPPASSDSPPPPAKKRSSSKKKPD